MSMRTETEGILKRYQIAEEQPQEVGDSGGVFTAAELQQRLMQAAQLLSRQESGGDDLQLVDLVSLTNANAIFSATGSFNGLGATPTFTSSPEVHDGPRGSIGRDYNHNGPGNLFPPRILGIDRNLEIGRQTRVDRLFEFMDLDGNDLHRLSVIDTTATPTSGYWKFEGRRLDPGRWHTFTVDELAGPNGNLGKLVFVSGLVVGVDKLNIRAEDTDGHTQRWSEPALVSISTVTPNTRPPVANFEDFESLASESYNLEPFISASDPDGYAIKKYRIKQFGNGTLYFNGNQIEKGRWKTLTPGELSDLTYETTNHTNGEKRGKFELQAYDGRFWSKSDIGYATIDPNAAKPITEIHDRSVARNESIQVHTMYSAEDPDGNTIKKVRFYDTGVDEDGGYFTVDGVQQAARTWITVDYEDLGNVEYNASSIFDSERFKVRVYDGRHWSKTKTGTVTTIEKPVIDVVATTVVNELEEIEASTLFGQGDPGPGLLKYQIIDLNDSSVSGNFELAGEELEAGVVHEITASQLDSLTFVGGNIDDRSMDGFMVRAMNEEYWSDWKQGAVNTEPWMIESLDQAPFGTWTAVPGTGVELTYSFLSRVPDYYLPDDQERTNFMRFNSVMRRAARLALEEWGQVSGISFREVDDVNGGDIRFGTADLGDDGILGWAYYPNNPLIPPKSGDIWINNESVLKDTPDDPFLNQDFGSPGFGTLIHEIGHAVGLSHPFDRNIRLPDATDSAMFTVMAYNRYPSGLEASAPQLYDVAAVQSMYGDNPDYNPSNTWYTFEADVPRIETIYDAGGKDTLNFDNQTKNVVVNLRPGHFSTYADEEDNLNIAYGTDIENARGGSGNDILSGNQLSNKLVGNRGNDMLTGFGGDDKLIGGEGDDHYFFGIADGNDVINDKEGGGWDRIRLDLTGIDLGEEPDDEAFFENFVARRVNNDLHISITPVGEQNFGSIVIENMGKEDSRMETLEIYQGDTQITRDVDLASVYVQAGDQYSRWVISDFSTSFGQIALPG